MTIQSYLRQVIAQRNALRVQNGQLWKIVEKQRLIIHQLKVLSAKNSELLKNQLPEKSLSKDSVDETLCQTDAAITSLRKEYDIKASQADFSSLDSPTSMEASILTLPKGPEDDNGGDFNDDSLRNIEAAELEVATLNPGKKRPIIPQATDVTSGVVPPISGTDVEHAPESALTTTQITESEINNEGPIVIDKQPNAPDNEETEGTSSEANILSSETGLVSNDSEAEPPFSNQKSSEVELAQMNELNTSESSLPSTSDQGLSGAESESLDIGQDFDKDEEYRAHDGSNFTKVEKPTEDYSTPDPSTDSVTTKMANDPTREASAPNTRKNSEPLVDLTGLRSLIGVDVKVNGSTVKVNSKGKEVLVFLISILKKESQEEAELWTIEKLYSDFLALDAKLKATQPRNIVNQIGKLPDKNLFATHAPSKVDQRKLALQQYLQHLLVLNMVDTRDVCEFFSTNLTQRSRSQEKAYGIKEGYLTKKGKNFGGWKRRYYSLKSPILNYCENKDGSILGSIRVSNCQISKQSASIDLGDDSYRHAFMIVEPKKSGIGVHRHIFCADSDAERDEWVAALLVYTAPGKHPSASPSLTASSTQDSYGEGGNKAKEKLKKFIRADSVKQPQTSAPSKQTAHTSQSAPAPIQKSVSIVGTDVSRNTSEIVKAHRKSASLKDPPTSSLNMPSSTKESCATDQQHVTSTSKAGGLPQSAFLKKPFAGNLKSNAQVKMQKEKEPKKGGRMTFHWGKKIFSSSSGSSEGKSKAPYVPVFGVPLEKAVEVSRVKDGYELPAVVYRCIEYLDAKLAHKEEGIYRLSGSSAAIKVLREKFDQDMDVNLLGSGVYYDVHAIAGLLKLYLRELPTSVLTHEMHQDFLHVIDLLNRKERVNELGRLVSTLPLANYTLLRCLIAHLIRIVQHADVNKMTVRNVGIVFSPTLGIPAGVFNLLMTEFEYIFSVNDQGFAAPRTIDDSDQEDNLEEPSTIPQEAQAQEDTLVNDAVVDSSNSFDQPAEPNRHEDEAQSFDESQFAASISKFKNPQFRSILRDRAGRNNRNSIIYAGAAPESMVKMEVGLHVRPTSGEYEEDVYDLVYPSGGSSGDNEMEFPLDSMEDEGEGEGEGEGEETSNEKAKHGENECEDPDQAVEEAEDGQSKSSIPEVTTDNEANNTSNGTNKPPDTV
ncbi:RhoGAP-domain-containing protein [Basidiobolus meristosporus CBS 931.73]|uniref:RhoGAP-domain-containing protein n=1 Tax=Basidiobolus meristosporus CBS 931.73 TaxID=1314790 RepID=A0A1Y1ZCR6_9FUNG|nr:RhoGAP-domain-containing protein [Basidiobolus meristosporus CBS 931.73]|eukprot:ORY07989.1 RhoGAP-domain-containing protein [Basidiobolus meristosporus CBS 931.73]